MYNPVNNLNIQIYSKLLEGFVVLQHNLSINVFVKEVTQYANSLNVC